MESLGLWFAAHPQLAGLAVFVIALAESMAVVGLVVPGVAMMFAAGALVGSGALEFGPICAWAIGGAIAGDGLSFWVGRHFREHLPSIWPFRRRPEILERGAVFFHRYGGRSVAFGRFVGPVRAVIPLVAGMLEMPAGRFLAVNVLSALLWAPAYLLPGMLFGASLDVASQVTSRLVMLLVMLLAGLWFTVWLTRYVYQYLRPRAHGLILYTFDLCKRHPLLGRLAAPLIDPQQRDYPGLLVWAVLLWGLCLVAGPLTGKNQLAVSLQAVRTPWSDLGLTLIDSLGQHRALTVLGGVVAMWLAVRRRNVALAHWLTALGFTLALEATTRWIPVASTPVDPVTLEGTVAYGFLAVLLADEIVRPAPHWMFYTGAAVLGGALGFSSLYFEAGTASTVLFSWLVSLIWLTLLGVAYRRHRPRSRLPGGLGWVTLATVSALLLIEARDHTLADFESPISPRTVAREVWLRTGWAALPKRRAQMFGPPSQPLEIQWAASSSALRRALINAGWQEAAPLTWTTALSGLNPAATLDQLPVLPHVNQSFIDRWRMIKREPNGRWLILRFWDSGHRLAETDEPIWLASCGQLRAKEILGVASYPRQRAVSAEVVGVAMREITGANRDYHVLQRRISEDSIWLLWATAGRAESSHRWAARSAASTAKEWQERASEPVPRGDGGITPRLCCSTRTDVRYSYNITVVAAREARENPR